MAISDQERQYFNTGINQLLNDIDKHTRASACPNKAQLIDVISCLDDFLNGNFVAAASAAGILTPNSISELISTSDTMKIKQSLQPFANTPEVVTKIINNQYMFSGTPCNVTACSFDNGSLVLNNVIAYGSTSIAGILSGVFACSAWASNNVYEDHWYTQTGNVADCNGPIPTELAFTSCLYALNVTISQT